jgi:Bacterial Ig-like domain (group 3)/Domain of unknown function (DUF5005)
MDSFIFARAMNMKSNIFNLSLFVEVFRLAGWRLPGILFFFFSTLFCTAQPILENGGFESGLGNWSQFLRNSGAATFSNSTASHNGTNALLVTVSATGTASNSVQLVSSSFAASSSDTYVLRFWANSSVLRGNLGVNLLGATPEFPQIPFEISTNPIGSYQEYLYAFKATGTVSIAFNFQNAGQYWLDDVEVLDVTNNDGFDVPMTYLWQWGELNFSRTNSLNIGWTGGDNDKSALLPDGSVAWIFNDSYSSTLDSFYSNIRGYSSLPRNCVVHQIGTNLIWMNDGNNTFFVPTNPAHIYWIAGCTAESNKLLVLLNELNNSPLTNVAMAVATLSLPDLKLEKITTLTSPGTDNFGDFVKGDDGYYYIYNGPKVARVPVGSLAVDSAWRYWNGSTWVADHTQNVAIPNFNVWSIARLGTSNYVSVFFPYLNFTDITAQFAPTPMGPWSSPVVVAKAAPQWGEIMYMPNICAGTDGNGVYTIGYSDNGSPENWFDKTYSDKSWYNPHFVTANLWRLSPYSIVHGNGGPGSRLSIKLAADQDYNNDYINNQWGAGVLNTTNWFNLFGHNGANSGVTDVPFYTFDGNKYASGAALVYKWDNEITGLQGNSTNNVALLDSFANVGNNCWYLSVTNLDAPFTNGYHVYFYYRGNTVGWGGWNYVRYYAGQTTNSPVQGVRQWNLYTTDTSNTGHFIQDTTPFNGDTTGETQGANYFVVSNLSGGAFDLLITNGNYGGVSAIEIVADSAATISTLTTSTNRAAYGATVTLTDVVNPAPPDGETVVFKDGNTTLGASALSGGEASYRSSILGTGVHSITAIYEGDGNYLASTSSISELIITPSIASPVAVPSANVYVGASVMLVCSNYHGTPPYNFQWQKSHDAINYADVDGAVTNSLTLFNLTTNDSAFYRLIFAANNSSATSSVVNLKVNVPPMISVQRNGEDLILTWPQQGTLLQATNLMGPWTTNDVTPPFTNHPTSPQMFYRVLTR